jgi:hypothetical protein
MGGITRPGVLLSGTSRDAHERERGPVGTALSVLRPADG